MRNFILVLLLGVSFSVFSQTENDSVLIPRVELERVFNSIDTLTIQDSIKTELINEFTLQLKNYEMLTNQDSILLMYQNRQINLLNTEIQVYDDRLKHVDKWYRKPWVGFVVGVATISTSSWIVSNIK